MIKYQWWYGLCHWGVRTR